MAEDNKQSFQKRQIACKVRIKEIMEGEYVKEEGWQPNFVKTKEGRRVSRINLISTIVHKQEISGNNQGSITLDDGTGKISVKSFDQNISFNGLSIGSLVLLIGRPREYGSEKYIVPEILKSLEDPKWAEVRKLELGNVSKKEKVPEAKENSAVKQVIKEEEIKEPAQKEHKGEDVFKLIKESDDGNGADVGEIITKLGTDEAEEIINNLLKEGEIFETRPGKVKILE